MVSSAPVILVVEDEYIIRAALVAELEQAGWKVLEARTGEAALAQLRGEHGSTFLSRIFNSPDT